MNKYTYDTIQTYVKLYKNEKCMLPELTQKRLNQLKNFISDKNYSVMPVFMKKSYNKNKFSKYKSTVPAKTVHSAIRKDNISLKEKRLNNIRRYLNKLSKSTYDDMQLSILETFKEMDEHYRYRVAHYIFEIASMNKFYSKLYALLYRDLCSYYENFKNVIDEHFKEFLKGINKIHYVNPKYDYDGYCNYTTIIQQKISFCCFLIELFNIHIIDINMVLDLMCEILETVQCASEEKECKEMNEDLIQMIVEMLKLDIHSKITNNEKFKDEILTILKDISNYDKNIYPGISLKIKFKLMDIL